MIRDRDRNVNRPTASYLYSIIIDPPLNQLVDEGLYTYTVEAYIHRNTDSQYYLCTCNYTSQSNVVVDFVANQFAGWVTSNFYIQAAVVSSTGALSDFQPYYVDSTCGSVIDLGEFSLYVYHMYVCYMTIVHVVCVALMTMSPL